MATIKSLIPARVDLKSLFLGDKKEKVIYNPKGLTPSQELEFAMQYYLSAEVEDWDGARTSDISNKVEKLQKNIEANPYLKPVINKYTEVSSSYKSDFYDLYGKFLSNSLQSFHGVSLNDIWLIDINLNENFLDEIINNIKKYEPDLIGQLFLYDKILKGAINDSHLLLAQGVSIVGDSGTINRIGTTNTGYIQGNVGMGRTPFNTLDMKILENNTSFVDFILRPWMVAVSHASLKEANLKTNITVYALSRRSGYNEAGFIPRKIFNYYGCVPIDIDNMEYNYTADTAPTLRSVKFAFNRYEMYSDLPKFEEYGRYKIREIHPHKIYPQKNSGLGDVLQNKDYDVTTRGSITDSLLESTLSPKILATKPTWKNDTRSPLDKFLGTMKDTAMGYAEQGIGMAQTAVNNTLGAVEGTTLSWVVKGEQAIAKPLNTAVEGLNVAVTSTLEKLNPSGRNDDATHHVENSVGRSLGNASYTNTNITIPQNDTPNISTVGVDPNLPYKPVFTDAKDAIGINGVKPDALLSYIVRPNPPINDVRHGEIIVGGKSINQNDRPDGLHDLQNILPNPDSNDRLTGKEQVGNIKSNPTKVTQPSKTIKFVYIATPANDVLRSK